MVDAQVKYLAELNQSIEEQMEKDIKQKEAEFQEVETKKRQRSKKIEEDCNQFNKMRLQCKLDILRQENEDAIQRRIDLEADSKAFANENQQKKVDARKTAYQVRQFQKEQKLEKEILFRKEKL